MDCIVKEGDLVGVNGVAGFRVLETAGHSDCSLSFYQASTGVLIISDVTGYYIPDTQAWWPMYFTGYEACVASIRRLADLKAEVVCLGHNVAIAGAEAVRAYFDGTLAATQAYHERIVDERGRASPRAK